MVGYKGVKWRCGGERSEELGTDRDRRIQNGTDFVSLVGITLSEDSQVFLRDKSTHLIHTPHLTD